MSYSRIYVNKLTGLASAAPTNTTPIASIPAVLGGTLILDVVFTDENSAPVFLATGSSGVFWCKPNNNFAAASYFTGTTWVKSDNAAKGYRFTMRVAGDALVAALGNSDPLTAMCGLVWTESGVEGSISGKISMPISNQGWRDNEPELETPDATYPLPGDIATVAMLNAALAAGKSSLLKSAAYNAAAGDNILADTSAGGFTLTLPGSPTPGAPGITIIDAQGAFAAHNLTVGHNGNSIDGAASDLVLDVADAALLLEFVGGAKGWQVIRIQ